MFLNIYFYIKFFFYLYKRLDIKWIVFLTHIRLTTWVNKMFKNFKFCQTQDKEPVTVFNKFFNVDNVGLDSFKLILAIQPCK